MGTSPNLCIQLNINLVKCRLKNTCISYVRCDAVLFSSSSLLVRVSSRSHLACSFIPWFCCCCCCSYFFGCYCSRGNSLFDEIFQNIKMIQHTTRKQRQKDKKKRQWDGNNVTAWLFSATAVQHFYILPFQWLVCSRNIRIQKLWTLYGMWLYTAQESIFLAENKPIILQYVPFGNNFFDNQ